MFRVFFCFLSGAVFCLTPPIAPVRGGVVRVLVLVYILPAVVTFRQQNTNTSLRQKTKKQ